MAPTMTPAQRRVVSRLIRRNIQGWGRPLAYTMQQLRLGGILAVTAIMLLVIDLVLNGGTNALHQRTTLGTLLGLMIFFAGAFGIFFVGLAAPRYQTARSQPQQELIGVVNAIVGDVVERYPFVPYYFITLRGNDKRLRAFAVSTALGEPSAWHGKRVKLTVTPGIDEVTALRVLDS